jgi:prevent-host-death family protein
MIAKQPQTTFGAFDAKTRFSELLERVERGDSITITKHGTPVARLVPLETTVGTSERSDAVARWRRTAKGLSLGGDGVSVSDLIREGRR